MAFGLLLLYTFMVKILDSMEEQNKESKDLIILLSRINNPGKCASGFFSIPVYTIFFPLLFRQSGSEGEEVVYIQFNIKMETCYAVVFYLTKYCVYFSCH